MYRWMIDDEDWIDVMKLWVNESKVMNKIEVKEKIINIYLINRDF